MDETILNTNPEASAVWKFAGRELGFYVEAPFILSTADGEFRFVALIRDFGSPHGMLVLTGAESDSYDQRAVEVAQSLGFGFSIVGDTYNCYNRQHFIDTLDDWQYFGSQPPPSWYSGKPWS